MTQPGPPRHRGLFWSAIVLALAALVGGSAFAYVTYAATAGPDGAVKGYFAALARADAPAALGFGNLPGGPTQLLTSSVLRAQRNVAPIRHVEIVSTDESGDTASVDVRYVLDFASASRQVSEEVQVVRQNGSWRLARTAATTQLRLQQAGDRATIMGGRVPDGDLLIFPGAVPITFDSPYLRLSPATSSVILDAQPQTQLAVQVTEAGRSAVRTAVETALRACLAGSKTADPRCPLPTSRAVPGSLNATVTAAGVRRAAVIKLAQSASGVVAISGTIKLVGRYSVLDFENQPVAKNGTVSVPLTATTHPTDPITIDWAGGT
ncbi:MAG: hypothetical protein QOI69_1151 [Pseudonocardiales bacterium]|jgi:hypothetical protein|nr:hypothetical protein [Pseudonocardiales bacterium]